MRSLSLLFTNSFFSPFTPMFSGDYHPRSHSIHVAISRDYQRVKIAQKLYAKLQNDYLDLERRFHSHSKWNQRADHRNLTQSTSTTTADAIAADKPPMTLEEFLKHERLKLDNIAKSKDIANQNIRRR